MYTIAWKDKLARKHNKVLFIGEGEEEADFDMMPYHKQFYSRLSDRHNVQLNHICVSYPHIRHRLGI